MAEEELWTGYSEDKKEEKGLTCFVGYHSESTEEENEKKGGKAMVCYLNLGSKMLKTMDGLHNQIIDQKFITLEHQKIVE